MKNKIFSVGIFKEGMRQLRAFGLAYLCISLLSALYTGYSYIIDAIMGDDFYRSMEVSPDSGSIAVISFWGVYVFLPLMCLTLFGYLNSRSASDYYHSMPNSRLCTVLSFSASIAAWFFSAFLADFLIEIVVGAACGFEVYWDELLMQLLSVIVSFIQLYGIMLISVSLATKKINQVVLSFMIAFLPRILILILSSISENGAPVLVGLSDALGIFAEPNINILFGGVFLSSLVDYSNALLYSLVLGIIYCVLGTICYIRRKSEAATLAGANKLVQCIIRVLAAFVVCLIPCFTLGTAFISAANTEERIISLIAAMPVIILVYGFAVIAYFLYEAISTRNIRGALTLKGTMGIGLIALFVLNLIFILAPAITANVALSADISTETVSSVSINTEYSAYDVVNENGYEKTGIDEVEFRNEQMISILCDALEDNINAIKSGNDDYFYYDRDYMYVEFHMNDGRVLKRYVYLTDKKYNLVCSIMLEDEAYRELLRRVPEVREAFSIFCSETELSSKQVKELYECLRDELVNMEDEEYFRYIGYDADDEDSKYENMIDCIYVEGTTHWHNNYPINSMVPKTMNLYISMVNNNNSERLEEVADVINNHYKVEVDVQFFSNDFSEKSGYGETYIDESEYAWLAENLSEIWNKPVNGDFYKVTIFSYDYEPPKYDGYFEVVHYVDADILERYVVGITDKF